MVIEVWVNGLTVRLVVVLPVVALSTLLLAVLEELFSIRLLTELGWSIIRLFDETVAFDGEILIVACVTSSGVGWYHIGVSSPKAILIPRTKVQTATFEVIISS